MAAVDGHGFRVTPVRAGARRSPTASASRRAAASGSRTRPATCPARTRPATSSGRCSSSRCARRRAPANSRRSRSPAAATRPSPRRSSRARPAAGSSSSSRPTPTPSVVERLRALGADLHRVRARAGRRRRPDLPRGSSTRSTTARVPFTCQGNLNGLRGRGRRDARPRELAAAVGRPGGPPRRPGRRPGRRRRARLVGDRGLRRGRRGRHPRRSAAIRHRPDARRVPRSPARTSGWPPASRPGRPIDAALAYAARHRSDFMWPWEAEPHSVAHGILDDETYDWLAVVAGHAGERRLAARRRRGDARGGQRPRPGRRPASTSIPPARPASPACSSLARTRRVEPDEIVAVLFTGIRRPHAAPGRRTPDTGGAPGR